VQTGPPKRVGPQSGKTLSLLTFADSSWGVRCGGEGGKGKRRQKLLTLKKTRADGNKNEVKLKYKTEGPGAEKKKNAALEEKTSKSRSIYCPERGISLKEKIRDYRKENGAGKKGSGTREGASREVYAHENLRR